MPQKFLRLREVLARTGLARSTIYSRIAKKEFPPAIALGSPAAVAWLESDIDEWIAARVRDARPELVAATA
jgi:prophage regulatory protein